MAPTPAFQLRITPIGIITSILGAGLLAVAIAWLITGMTIFQSVPLPPWLVHVLAAIIAYDLITTDIHIVRQSKIPESGSDDEDGALEFGPGDEWEQENL